MCRTTASSEEKLAGVYITGWLIDRTGSYNAPFFLTAAVGIVGAIVYLLYASGVREIE